VSSSRDFNLRDKSHNSKIYINKYLWQLTKCFFGFFLLYLANISCDLCFYLRNRTVQTLRHQNSVQEEIKSRFKSGNACYHSVHNLLSTSLLPKNIKIKGYRTVILFVVLYGCEAWPFTFRVEYGLSVFENRVLSSIFRP